MTAPCSLFFLEEVSGAGFFDPAAVLCKHFFDIRLFHVLDVVLLLLCAHPHDRLGHDFGFILEVRLHVQRVVHLKIALPHDFQILDAIEPGDELVPSFKSHLCCILNF